MWRLTWGCVHTDYCPESERWWLWITVWTSVKMIIACYKSEIACKTFRPRHSCTTQSHLLSWKSRHFQKVHILYELRGIKKDFDSTSSPVRSWKRSLLIAFPAVVVYFCRSVFWIHVYSCAAVNLQANRTHAVTTDSFPLTSHALENSLAQPNGITQYSHRSYCNLDLSGRHHQGEKKELPLTFFMWHICEKYQLEM